MRPLPLALLAAVALAACERSATAPVAPPVAALRGPSRAVYFQGSTRQIELNPMNLCTGATYTGTGNDHFFLSDATDSAGGVHDTYHEQITGIKLTGSDGTSYVGSDVNLIVSNYTAGGTQMYTISGNSPLVGKGQAPNAVYRFQVRIFTNPDGTTASFVYDQTLDCH